MRLLATILFAFLLICTSIAAQEQQTEGGITLLEWNKKCGDYFKQNPKSTEKEFLVLGYCESFVCEIVDNNVGMRIDSCPGKSINGKRCIQKPIKSLPYPQCCRLKCFDK